MNEQQWYDEVKAAYQAYLFVGGMLSYDRWLQELYRLQMGY
jgi:hypothetical protein